jgi:hypothetical protein
MLAHPGTGGKEVFVERFSFSSEVAFVPRHRHRIEFLTHSFAAVAQAPSQLLDAPVRNCQVRDQLVVADKLSCGAFAVQAP